MLKLYERPAPWIKTRVIIDYHLQFANKLNELWYILQVKLTIQGFRSSGPSGPDGVATGPLFVAQMAENFSYGQH
jgi:hypothetical protein